jgi:hypothetical protein
LTRRSVSLMIRFGRDIFAGNKLVVGLVDGLVRKAARGAVVFGVIAEGGVFGAFGDDQVLQPVTHG